MNDVATLEVPADLKAAILAIAAQAQREERDVTAEAIRGYVARNAEYLRRVRAGLAAADRGDFAGDAQMEALFARLAHED